MGLRPTRGDQSGCHPEPFAVILSAAKDLQFRAEANSCRFFAALRMTAAESFSATSRAGKKGRIIQVESRELLWIVRESRQ